MKIKLVKKIKETKDSYSFVFKPEKEITWKPGQYIFYKIPHEDPDDRGMTRPFTISTAPFEKNIMLTTKFDFKKGSTFKKALFDLKEGSVVETSGLKGDFVIKNFKSKLVFIAGGVGITPYRSILLDLVHKEKDPEVIMFYGNKEGDIIFKDTFDKLVNNHNWLKIFYIIEPQLIDSNIIKKNVSDLYNNLYYISGPFKMVQIIQEMSLKMNIESKNIIEDYFPGYTGKNI
ncbi:MAG: FAD-dependent oxidoreductase [Actinobacteria bacterium]|nr:FAD-dependent oxidoreductase [Actinomycetota bacterium]